MPSSTPNYGIPYPVGSDPIDFAGDLADLALQVDASLADVQDLIYTPDSGEIEEIAVDAVAAAFAAGTQTGISVSYNDPLGTLSMTVAAPSAATNSSRGTLYGISDGSHTVALGNGALGSYSASANSGIGFEALSGLTSGSSNTALGFQAGSNVTSGMNNTLIGRGAQASSATVSNQITLGNSSVTGLRCNVQTISSLSDERDKSFIDDLGVGLDFVNHLRPVKFVWNTRDGARYGDQDAGFLAQDLAYAEDQIGAADFLQLTLRDDPDRLEASYGRLVPVLVRAIQELTERVIDLEAELDFVRMSSVI